MAGAVLVAFAVFALTNPYALLDAGQFWVNLTQQNSMVSGAVDVPYTRQYIGTLPYAYFVRQLAQWGLGWLLGFAAWGGLMWAVAAAVRRVAGRGHLVALAWALPYFAVTGLFHAKFLRYMLPLLPFLLLFAAGGAVALLGLMRTRRARAVWAGGVTVVLASAALWCLAFTGGVYRQEHPWLQASRWIYENIPADSTLVSEQWDDALPLGLSELRGAPPPHTYLGIEVKPFDAESQAKLNHLSAALADADYVVLATDRLSSTIGRLPQRYPMTSQYYRMLDSGELGYRLVAEFATYPTLGGLTIRDGSADESFRVYDHPHVRIYANEGRLSEGALHTRLGRYLPLGVAHASPGGAAGGRAPGKALELRPQDDGGDDRLMLGQSPGTLPVVDDFRWNTAAAGSPALALLVWWLAVSLFGWAAWPLLFPLLGGLRDRGYGIARQLGWLIVGYVFWMGASLGVWENRLPVLAGLLGLLAIAGLLAGFRQRAEIALFLREHRRLVLGEELLFAGALAAFTGIRMLNPDLWQPWFGGEKFMEFAFLNAILRSPTFPPYDPYFAGGTINYYYYGLYLVSLPVKLTGVPPEVSFNLAVPALFAVSVLAVFSLGYTMAQGRRRAVAAGLAVTFALVLGNLEGFSQLLRVVREGKTPLFSHYDYWAASRVIPQTINEFPYWTFLFADLHPHMIAIPFGLAVAGLALSWLRGKAKPATLVIIVVALGALGPANTWDLPVYGLLLFAAFLLAAWRARRRWPLVEALLLAGAAVGLAVVAYFPFFARYQTMVGGGDGGALGRYLGVASQGSPPGDWLMTWGGLLVLPASYLGWSAWRAWGRAGGEAATGLGGSRRRWALLMLALLGAALALVAAGRVAAAIALPMSALFAVLLFRRDISPGETFTCLLAALGLAILGGIELVYLRDFLDGSDWMRMNTVFKFSVPAWLFLGAANATILAGLWPRAARSRSAVAGTWQVLAVAVVITGLAFLVPGTGARVNDRFPGQRPARNTLDGMAFMTVGEYTWPDPSHLIELRYDYAAIRWLLENARGASVLAEAPAGDYRVNGEELGYDYYRAGGLRAASLTGLATFVGHHQLEQRPGLQVLVQAEEGQELFWTPDLGRARELLRQFDVRYIYVGALERYLFPAEGLAKFEEMAAAGDLRVAYQNEHVTVYAREP